MNSLVSAARVTFVVAPGTAAVSLPELELALRGPVADRLDTALGDRLPDPAAVIFLRHVHVDVNLPASLGDEMVRAWARQLAAGIGRAVERDGQVVLFPDENCYWAGLLADLIGGRAPEWYQEVHAEVWETPRPEAVADVLDRSGDPGGVLFRVAERHPQALVPLLATLRRPAAAVVARQALGTGAEGEDALIAAALVVADRRALWIGPRWSPERVRATGVRPAVADWGSTQALTAAVVGVVAELVRLRVLAAPGPVSRTELAAEPSLAWLDPDVLATGLSAVPSPDAPMEASFRELPAASGRRSEGAAPTACSDRPDRFVVPEADGIFSQEHHELVEGAARRQRLAADIARIVTAERAALESFDNEDAAALFLQATLTSTFPQWSDVAFVGPTIRRVVASWEIEFREIESWGIEPARPRSEAPAGTASSAGPLDEGAGVLLLLRAVSDLRLPAVIRRADSDPDAVPSALLAAARHLAGTDPTPAMAVFAGLVDTMPDRERLAELTAPWSLVRGAGLAHELRTVLRAQGLDAGELEPDQGVGPLVAEVVLRAWRRWLGALARSSTGYLLTQFLRRPGRVEVDPGQVLVTLASRPLDVVLEQVGYLLPLPSLGLLGGRDLVFRTED